MNTPNITYYHPHMPHDHSAIIAALQECVAACEQGITALSKHQDKQGMADCLALQQDCADICTKGVQLLERNAPISHSYLLICEEMCRLCATECAKHNTPECKACAEMCEKCAVACHQHYGQIVQAREANADTPPSIH